MNLKYLIAGIGCLIFSILVILFVLLQLIMIFEEITIIIFFLLISCGIVLMGIGFKEVYLMHKKMVSILIFINSIAVGFLLTFFYSAVRPYFNTLEINFLRFLIFDITFIFFSLFFILIGYFFIRYKSSTKYSNLTLISGILSVVFSNLNLILTNILFLAELNSDTIRYYSIYPVFDRILNNQNWWDILILLIISIVSQTFAASMLLIFGLLPLGFIGILIGVIFFIEAKNEFSK
ncbi:MAG: hypothetical protein ACFFDN_45330 [Candidatus Hodarchaeota archaeon]